jgi:hypothetical protein
MNAMMKAMRPAVNDKLAFFDPVKRSADAMNLQGISNGISFPEEEDDLMLEPIHELNAITPGESSEEETQLKKRRGAVSKRATKFRTYQKEKWQERYEELVEYKKQNKNCLVPHCFGSNPCLARWVKRQRYQRKLLHDGQKSTMTHERVKMLDELGFVWDSHEASWQERLSELIKFRVKNGHCMVPSTYEENPQLATWVKCQRRQYKLFWEGRQSNMTVDRIMILEEHGFKWELRSSGFAPKNAKLEVKTANVLVPVASNCDYNALMDILADDLTYDPELDQSG